MNNLKRYSFSLVCCAALFVSYSVKAGAKSYQVTGPVLELSPTMIVVQKGDERWEIDRNSNTKIKGDLKVGAKVTIHYTMTADDVEVKDAKPKSDSKKSKPGN